MAEVLGQRERSGVPTGGDALEIVYFFYCCPDCPSCPASAIHMDQATWAIWATIKKYSLMFTDQCFVPVTCTKFQVFVNCVAGAFDRPDPEEDRCAGEREKNSWQKIFNITMLSAKR